MNRRGPRHRGFIILFGTRTIVSNDGAATAVQTNCPRCNRQAQMLPKSYRQWFTIFFIPIFPMSGAKKLTQCSACGAQFGLSTDQLRNRANASSAQQNQQAISLYNSLRASPGNSITLNQLMTTYASMQEFDQAISSASQFPQALHASEQCMTTLGRVYLAQNKYPEALQWFDAAIERNAQLGEAQYFKGVAHMLSTPPDLTQAIASARSAKNLGYPQADVLLRQAEEKARQSA